MTVKSMHQESCRRNPAVWKNCSKTKGGKKSVTRKKAKGQTDSGPKVWTGKRLPFEELVPAGKEETIEEDLVDVESASE